MATEQWIRRAQVSGRLCDVRLRDGSVAEVLDHRPAAVDRGEGVDASGGALLPGLHDHHIHLAATAAAWTSVDLERIRPPTRDAMVRALRADRPGAPVGDWVRAVGYHEEMAGDLDRHVLDGMVGDRPLRVQHRSGAAWFVNTSGLRHLGLLDGGEHPDGIELGGDGIPTGRLVRLDRWIRERSPWNPPDLSVVAQALIRTGVTGCTDATPWESATDCDWFARSVADLPIRVRSMAAPGQMGGSTTKLVLGDHELPALDELERWISTSHDLGRPVAVHSVTAASLALAIAAWSEVGVHPGDRVEHAAVVHRSALPVLRELGVHVVTQPGLVAQRGDSFRRDSDPAEVGDLWRCRSLLEADIPVGAGSDAPYGPIDPWVGVSAAIERRTAAGALLGSGERLAPARAIELWLSPLERPGGPPRQVLVGAPADLCVLDAPLDTVLAEPSAEHVVATIVGGAVAHHR